MGLEIYNFGIQWGMLFSNMGQKKNLVGRVRNNGNTHEVSNWIKDNHGSFFFIVSLVLASTVL